MDATFYDGQTATPYQVRLEQLHAPPKLVIRHDEFCHYWDFASIQVDEKPSLNMPGRLSHPSMPGAQLILEHTAYQSFASHLKPIRIDHSSLKLIAAVIIGVLLTVFVLLPILVPKAAKWIPYKWEASLGNMAYGQLVEGRQQCAHPGHLQRMRIMADRLMGDQWEHPIRLQIIKHRTANAFALPGGIIVLHSALIEEAESPEEVVGVLAHELGHVYHRHSLEHVLYIVGLSGIVDLATGGGGTITAIGVSLIETDYSREHEREADQFAAKQMAEHGYALTGMIDFFQRQLDTEDEDDFFSDALSWFSTHPASEERIAFLRNYQPAYDSTPIMTPKEWDEFKQLKGCFPPRKK